MRRSLLSMVLVAVGWLIVVPASAEETPSDATKWELPEIASPAPGELQQAIDRGIDFLLADQNPDGSWGSATRTKDLNIYAPVPGAHHAFRAAVTALAVLALMETGSPDRADVQESIARGAKWLDERLPHVRRANATAIYNVWAHGYAIQALAELYRREKDPAQRERWAELIRLQYDLLTRYESVDGGWGYYDFDVGSKRPAASSTSFVSAAILVAFYDAKQAGIEPPADLVRRAVDSINRQRKPDFSYFYGEYLKWRPMLGINRPGGSLGRSQACNVALQLWGEKAVTNDVIKVWLARLFHRNGWLDIGRKRPIPHESWFQVAAYFYYFGHYYAGRCIEQLEPGERPLYQAHLARTLLKLQETDGSWWDFPFYNYHQQYGTAFALMTLHRCRPPGSAATEQTAQTDSQAEPD